MEWQQHCLDIKTGGKGKGGENWFIYVHSTEEISVQKSLKLFQDVEMKDNKFCELSFFKGKRTGLVHKYQLFLLGFLFYCRGLAHILRTEIITSLVPLSFCAEISFSDQRMALNIPFLSGSETKCMILFHALTMTWKYFDRSLPLLSANTPSGLEAPSWLPFPLSSRCGSANQNMMKPALQLCTGSVSKDHS